MSIYWIVLFIACVTEIAWAISLKLLQQNFNLFWISVSGILTVLNMALLSFSMRGIPVGTAYAVWTGLGAVGVVTIGIVQFGDALTLTRLTFLSLIIIGVIGLKLIS
jgi:quaternary ammonium compound-resistance protein SugE